MRALHGFGKRTWDLSMEALVESKRVLARGYMCGVNLKNKKTWDLPIETLVERKRVLAAGSTPEDLHKIAVRRIFRGG